MLKNCGARAKLFASAPIHERFRAHLEESPLNFTFITDASPVDVLGEVTGVGDYEAVLEVSENVALFGATYRCIGLDALIVAKRAAGRPKDLEAVAELELIRDEKSGAQPSDE